MGEINTNQETLYFNYELPQQPPSLLPSLFMAMKLVVKPIGNNETLDVILRGVTVKAGVKQWH
jgi:hypothetical protein